MTAIEVADLAGVSQSAVSRAFTPGASVSPATRERIEAAARKLGYRPNALARSLIMGRSRIIGAAMAYLENQFYPEVLEQLSFRLQALGYHLLLFTAKPDQSADPILSEVISYQIDGLVLASTLLSSAVARECQEASIPVVMLNRTSQSEGVSSVVTENEKGAATIAAFLAKGGHKRFAYISGLQHASTNRDRERGYSDWLKRNGFGPPMRAAGHYSFSGAAEAARVLLSQKKRPDAIFCANDHMAIAAIEVVRHEYGLRIPEDVSIVGFDDVGAARWPSYSLTTFSQPVGPMVDEAVNILVELISDPDKPARQTVLPGELVVRNSARIPPGVVNAFERRIWRLNEIK